MHKRAFEKPWIGIEREDTDHTAKERNADRIRKATDKELADMLCEITRCCSDCIAQETCCKGHTGYEDWLASKEWSDFS